MKRVLGLFFGLLLLESAHGLTIWGVDVNGVEIQTGAVWILNAVSDSAPDPICNTVGLSVPFRFMSYFTFRPEAQFFFQTYGYQSGRAVPIESMFDNVVVMSLLINPNFGMEFPISPLLTAYAEGGFGFLARFPIFLNGTTAGQMTLPITGWFLGGRFLYPNFGGGIAWQFSPLFALTFRGQFLYPVFNLWNGYDWYDEMTFSFNVGLRFTF